MGNTSSVSESTTHDTLFGGSRLLTSESDEVVEAGSLEPYTHRNAISQIIVCGDTIYSASLDKTVVAWDKMTGSCRFAMVGHRNPVTALALCDNVLYSASQDRTVRVWDPMTGDLRRRFFASNNWLTAIAATPQLLFVGCYDGDLKVFDTQTCRERLRFLNGRHYKQVRKMSVHRNLLATCSLDCTIKLWDISSGECVNVKFLSEPVQHIEIVELSDGMRRVFYNQNNHVGFFDIGDNLDHVPFVGLSDFTVRDNILVGWNRREATVEFWDIRDRVRLGVEKVLNAVNVSSFQWDNNDNSIDIESLKAKRSNSSNSNSNSNNNSEAESLNRGSGDRPQSPQTTSAAVGSVQSNELYFVVNNRIRKTAVAYNSAAAASPAYLHFQGLVSYCVETLMIPATAVVRAIEVLYEQRLLTVDMQIDAQITVLCEYVNQLESDLITCGTTLYGGITYGEAGSETNSVASSIESSGLSLSAPTASVAVPMVSTSANQMADGASANTHLQPHEPKWELYVDAHIPGENLANSSASTSNTSSTPPYTQRDYSLPFQQKRTLFYSHIQPYGQSANAIPLVNPLLVTIRRDNVFADACKNFSNYSPARGDFAKKLLVYFIGEEGLDLGGVKREFYQLLSAQVLNIDNGLFDRTGVNMTCHPNAASAVNEAHLEYFRVVGRIIGKALLDGDNLDLHFTPALCKMIIGRPVTYRDLENVDSSLFRSMEAILKEDVSYLDLSFVADIDNFGANNSVELIENGANISVTQENKKSFVELYSRWKIVESVRSQIEHFLFGIYEVVPRKYFKLFDEKEFVLLLCGPATIDVDQWQRCSRYKNYTESSQAVRWFWEVLAEFDDVTRSKVLQFVTGTACVPTGGFAEFNPPFIIYKIFDASQLPVAHTCFNRLDLPDYPTKDTLREMLLKAISFGLLGFGIE